MIQIYSNNNKKNTFLGVEINIKEVLNRMKCEEEGQQHDERTARKREKKRAAATDDV